jgi:hypothetical protein
MVMVITDSLKPASVMRTRSLLLKGLAAITRAMGRSPHSAITALRNGSYIDSRKYLPMYRSEFLPSMHYRHLVDFSNAEQDSILEFLARRHSDMFEKRGRHLTEQRLYQLSQEPCLRVWT